jgi:hypothetical protein
MIWTPPTADQLLAMTDCADLRSLADTVGATRAWFAAQPEERRNAPLRAGIKPEREAEVLAAWKSRGVPVPAESDKKAPTTPTR